MVLVAKCQQHVSRIARGFFGPFFGLPTENVNKISSFISGESFRRPTEKIFFSRFSTVRFNHPPLRRLRWIMQVG